MKKFRIERNPNLKKGNSKSRPHEKFKSKNFKQSKSDVDLSKVECWKCHKFGHYAYDCPNKKFKGKKAMNTTLTWDDSDGEEDNDDSESQGEDISNYPAFTASLSSSHAST